MLPKILVGCPTADAKSYCLDRYVEGLKSLTYPNFDILLIDNSATSNYFDRIKSLDLPVEKDSPQTKIHDSIVHSRNILRHKVIEGNYDYFLSLEQDVIPPKDIIERLLANKKNVITGVYYTFYRFFGVPKLRPLIWKDVEGQPDKMQFMNTECRAALNSKDPILKSIKACGLGCLLIHRSILEKIKFRVPENYSTFDDFMFCEDVRKLGEKVWADLSVQCDHLVQQN